MMYFNNKHNILVYDDVFFSTTILIFISIFRTQNRINGEMSYNNNSTQFSSAHIINAEWKRVELDLEYTSYTHNCLL